MKIHMVKSGESMYSIAQKYGVKLEELIASNPQVTNPDQIDVGMKVKIPTTGSHAGNPGAEHFQKYTVVQGDSLWKISKAWGLPLKAVIDANPQLKNPNVLLSGEIVNIPKQGHMPVPLPTPMPNPAANNNVANSLSPAFVPQPSNAPLPTAINQPITQPAMQAAPVEAKLPVAAESNMELMSIQTSEPLFKQIPIPAVEATGKAEGMQANQKSTWDNTVMPQWESSPSHTSPIYANSDNNSPAYANPMKADCGCGCGDNMNTMSYNPYQSPYSAPPTYYIPEPMLGYSMQEPMQDSMHMQQQMQNYNQMQFPVSAGHGSPFGYMVPCYPMGANGDMGYLHGMQTPYSPWINSNENSPALNALAENAGNTPINEHVNDVLGSTDTEGGMKKRTKIPKKSNNRPTHKHDDRAVLHNFLQKKTEKAPAREYKYNEPWINR